MKKINQIISYLLIILVKGYQYFLSPLLGKNCRYQPTCSHYMLEAIGMHGAFVGVWLGIKRIVRCHPWGRSGYDPVPKNKHKL